MLKFLQDKFNADGNGDIIDADKRKYDNNGNINQLVLEI